MIKPWNPIVYSIWEQEMKYTQIYMHSHPLFLNTSGLAVQESTSHLKFYTVPNG